MRIKEKLRFPQLPPKKFDLFPRFSGEILEITKREDIKKGVDLATEIMKITRNTMALNQKP